MRAAFAGLAAVGIGTFVKKSLDAADAIGKTADVIGISTDALQEYRHVANLSGVATSLMESSFQAFAKRVGEAKQNTGPLITFLKKFDNQLLENIKNARSTDEALGLVFERMGQTASATDRAAIASAAFSRAGIKMVNFVKNGAAGLNKMRQEARDLGIVLNEDFIRASENANDQLEKLTRTLKTQATTAVIQFAPQIAEMAQLFTEAIIDMRKAQKELADDVSIDVWGENFVDVIAFAADSARAAYKVIGGGFKIVGKTLAAGSAQLVSLFQGDFKAIGAIGREWLKDMKAIFGDLEDSGDLFRKKLDEIRSRRRLLPDVDKDKKDLKELTQLIDKAGEKDKKLKFDTGTGEVFNDLKVLFDVYENELPRRLQESLARSSEAIKDAFDIEDLATDPEAMFEAYDEGMQRRLEESQERWRQNNQVLVDLTQNTAESMQSTFSDVFFDAMTGELKSLQDYADAIFKSISRTIADLLSKQLVEGLFNTGQIGAGGGGAAKGGIFSFIGRLFAGLFHGGGIVGRDDAKRRAVPAASFIGAPRLHAGFMPGEYPAILRRDEAVLTPQQLKALAAGGGGRREIRVYNSFNIQAPGGRVAPQSINQMQSSIYAAMKRADQRNN